MAVAQLRNIHLGHDEEVGCVAPGRAPSSTAVCAVIHFYLVAASLEDVVAPESAQCSDLVSTRSRRGRVQIRYKRRAANGNTTGHQQCSPAAQRLAGGEACMSRRRGRSSSTTAEERPHRAGRSTGWGRAIPTTSRRATTRPRAGRAGQDRRQQRRGLPTSDRVVGLLHCRRDATRARCEAEDAERHTIMAYHPGCAEPSRNARTKANTGRAGGRQGADPPPARMQPPALVAQGIEHRFPKPCVAGSNPAGGTQVRAMVGGAGRSSWSHPWSQQVICSLRAAQDLVWRGRTSSSH